MKITETQYKAALKTVKDYEKQLKESKPKECTHYYTQWIPDEQRFVCPDCGDKGPKLIKK